MIIPISMIGICLLAYFIGAFIEAWNDD